ncbi:MAG: hypothetical protein PUP92_01555 [Rhizonema sp. PD38]|nr:hypothetical protein [Rhizonema sp. PD38]
MNETDTSKQRAVAKSDKTVNLLKTKQQASCPFYSVLPNENMVTALPLLAPAENTQYESEPQRSSPQQDWVAEPDGEKQAIIDSEFNKLLALNEELRSANNNLYEQVEDLTDTLEESEKALQLQKKRSSVTESLLNQQTQELAAAQEQINSLFQQLETAVQTVQRQETTVETYKAQLEISQQRLAQLERECALIQSNYTEQSHQLSQSESACRELRTRLMRQQRQTLQFKAALDKCLETPLPSYDSLNDYGLKQSRHSQKASSFSNTQTIPPWSVETECFTNQESASPAHQQDDLLDGIALQQTNQPKDLGQEVICPIFDSSLASEIEDTLTPIPPAAASEIIDGSTTPEAASPTISGNLDEQLDSVIQMFFRSQPASTSPPPPNREEESEKNNSVEQPIWEIFATSIPDTENSEDEVVTLNQKNSENFENENSDDYWSEMSTETTSPQSSFSDNSSDVNSPSPIVYPQRPPKRRKSLAFVELPNFRR